VLLESFARKGTGEATREDLEELLSYSTNEMEEYRQEYEELRAKPSLTPKEQVRAVRLAELVRTLVDKVASVRERLGEIPE
jgi:hypothetical protein